MPMTPTDYSILERAVSNRNWPQRVDKEKDREQQEKSIIEAYDNELKNIQDAGWLVAPLHVTWDDWNLEEKEGMGDWDPDAPSHFIDKGSSRAYSLAALGVH